MIISIILKKGVGNETKSARMDIQFKWWRYHIYKNFVMSSGSLKEVAKLYHITYPTVRLRLDRLIQKMQMNDQIENDAYISLIKKMVIDDQLDFDTAKILIKKYREQKGE